MCKINSKVRHNKGLVTGNLLPVLTCNITKLHPNWAGRVKGGSFKLLLEHSVDSCNETRHQCGFNLVVAMSVCLYVHSPCNFFEALQWPCDHMISCEASHWSILSHSLPPSWYLGELMELWKLGKLSELGEYVELEANWELRDLAELKELGGTSGLWGTLGSWGTWGIWGTWGTWGISGT